MSAIKKLEKPRRSKTKATDAAKEQGLSEARRRASTGQLLLHCARLLSERVKQRATETKGRALKAAHASLLPQLDFEGARVVDLAGRLSVTKQAVSQTVSELVDAGIVELVADPTDGRAKLVRLTKKGADAAAQELHAMSKIEAELEREMGQKQLRALHTALLTLDEAFCAGGSTPTS